jgi:V/A-type H+-transporting ATPase subunit A
MRNHNEHKNDIPGRTAVAGRLTRIVGALAEATGLGDVALNELVRVGHRQLLGEVLRITGDTATLQVFEETSGVRVGEPVEREGRPLAIELGPGLLGSVIDGIGRPLSRLADQMGQFILAGATLPTLDRTRRFSFVPICRSGDRVAAGDVLGTIEERGGFALKLLVPFGQSGIVDAVHEGEVTVADEVVVLDSATAITPMQRWPVRRPRPVAARVETTGPFLTGQRVLDFLFPVAEGGTVAMPGGFGTGKTVLEQTLAKYGDADVVVYIGCGERGNEMADVLHDFSTLSDARSGRPLMDRTVLVVNTSNMPVAARESSVYVGLTIAEYFRDMGYRVAVMADSLSRWAEALREVGSGLQEMPGEEGYPTSLASRTAKLHERAGRKRCLGRPEREGSVTLISAVSPPSGDFSEPVTQACLYVAGALWALDPTLAHQRQFPAVDWETSYSLYGEAMTRYFDGSVDPAWSSARARVLDLLQRDAELREVATVVGPEALEDRDRLLLAIAAALREFVLGQSAFDPNDAFSPPAKTFALAEVALRAFDHAGGALNRGIAFADLRFDHVRRALAHLRDAPATEIELARRQIDEVLAALTSAPIAIKSEDRP